MIELTPARRRELRAAAHHLNPVVTIAGNGLTAGVLAEIDRSLQAHELIKIKVQGAERDARETLFADVCQQLDAAAVQHIGNVLILWRQRREEEKTPAAAAATAAAKPASVATNKSARAFAAAARRAALIKASADKRRSADKRGRGASRSSTSPRGK